MWRDWRTTKTVQWVLDEFETHVLRHNVSLSRNLLSGRVMAVMSQNPKYLNFAERVWTFLRSPHHRVKPNQMMYSQMLTVYRLALSLIPRKKALDTRHDQGVFERSKYITKQAVILVSQWVHEYKTDPDSLQGQLVHVDIHCPIILSQMIKLVVLRENIFCWRHKPWMLNAVRFYVSKCLELGLGVDESLKEILVMLVHRTRVLHQVQVLVDDVIIPVIGKENFLLFDQQFGHRIIDRILALGDSKEVGMDALLYAFRLRYLCHDHPQNDNHSSYTQINIFSGNDRSNQIKLEDELR